VSGRIQGLFQDVNTPTRDQIWTKRWGVAPSMVYDFQQGTKATLYYIYQGEEGVSDYGFTYLPQPAFSPLTGLQTNPGYYGNGRPTPPLPVSPHQFPRARGRTARRYHDDRYRHHHGKDRA
jgi:catecholate siderophore receptor